MWPFRKKSCGVLFLSAVVLSSCQSSEDRYWSDMQVIMGKTQPKRGV